MKYKKLVFGIPSLLSAAIIFFLTYVYFFDFIPKLINEVRASFLLLKIILKKSYFLAFCLGLVHTFLASMTLWSLVKTLISNPGYIPSSFFV